MAGVRWTDAELKFLEENYTSKNSCKYIAETLGRSIRAVYTMADRMGLSVQWEYRRIDKDGYVEVVLGSSVKKKEHRYVYEQEYGIVLSGYEHIHHLDEDKQNNVIENLVMMSPANHNRLHAMIERKDIEALRKFEAVLLYHDVPKYQKWLNSFFLQCDIV
ncbi:HNH endonuclease [Lederbergia citrisecunda]|uniref:HNH endonuclease n=1 Tax=Lederbergia citrisecunda TaxID=2833583 RepID=UPI003D2DDBC5